MTLRQAAGYHNLKNFYQGKNGDWLYFGACPKFFPKKPGLVPGRFGTGPYGKKERACTVSLFVIASSVCEAIRPLLRLLRRGACAER